MENTKYITDKIWEKVETEKTKIAKRVYNVLNYDVMSVILFTNTNRFYVEKTYSEAIIPNFVYSYVKKFYCSLGYKYLYD